MLNPTSQKMLEDLKKCPSGSLNEDLSVQTLEERFNEQWLAGIAKFIVENGWKKDKEDI